MFKAPGSASGQPTLDLETVHETLAYVHDDLRRIPELRSAAAALETAMQEVRRASQTHRVIVGARFTLLSRYFKLKH